MKKTYVNVGIAIAREGEFRDRKITIKTKEGERQLVDSSPKDFVKTYIWDTVEIPTTEKDLIGLAQKCSLGMERHEVVKVLAELESDHFIFGFDLENPDQTFEGLKQLQWIPQGYVPLSSQPEKSRVCIALRDSRVSELEFLIWSALQKGWSVEDIFEQANVEVSTFIKAVFELVKEHLIILI